ncbi:MAG: VTT domain-containing protein [Candidatus Paceibacterota bacterium]
MVISEDIKGFGKELTIKTLFGIVFGIFLVYISFKFVQVDMISEFIDRLGIFGPLILIFAKVLTLVVAPINGTPFYILGAAIYGPVWGAIYVFIGDMIGAAASFAIARTFGRGIVLKLFSKKEEALIPKILDSMSTVKGLFIIHVVLITFPDIVNYVAGLSKVKFRTFMLVHFPFALFFAFATSYATTILLNIKGIGTAPLIVFSFVAAALGIYFLQKYGNLLSAQKKVE